MVGGGGAWPKAVAHPVSGPPAKKREKDGIDGQNEKIEDLGDQFSQRRKTTTDNFNMPKSSILFILSINAVFFALFRGRARNRMGDRLWPSTAPTDHHVSFTAEFQNPRAAESSPSPSLYDSDPVTIRPSPRHTPYF